MAEVPQQLRKLKQALPIPSGGLKLLFAVFTIVGTLIASALAIYMAITNPDSNLGFLCTAFAFAYWLGLLIFACWTAFSFARLEPTWPGTWLKRYWHNNVIGYDACIHLDQEGEYCVQIVNRGKTFATYNCCLDSKEDRFMMRLNLGGWRNHTFNLFLDTPVHLTELEYWQVKLKRLGFYHEHITIQVRDGNDNTTCLEAKDLLLVLTHNHRKRGGLAGDIVVILRDLLDYSNHKYDQWQEEREYSGQIEESLRLAHDTMRVTIEDLDDSRRFIKSKEAQEIRQSLNARFEEIFPPEPINSQAA